MSKIVLISPKDNNFYNFRSELIFRLRDLGHEVVLVCPYGEKINYFVDRGCRFVNINIDRRGTSLLNDFKLLVAYKRLLGKENPDIVLTYTTKCSVYGGMICRLMRIPYIVNNAGLIDSDNALLGQFLRFLYRLGFSGAGCMMYQNSQERDIVNKLTKYKLHYRDIPGSGVNLVEFDYKPYPVDDTIVTFNYVARIVSIKGISEFLKCAEIIKKKNPNTRFVIYGDYDEDDYRRRIEELEKKHIVEYGGVQLDMKPCIEAAHAVIHPSYYEGMTNVILEHSAMGRPCLGSNISGVKEGIEDGKTGFLFNVKDVDSMVLAVENFLHLSHEEKVAMGKQARLKMEKEFNREIVTAVYLEEINKVIGVEP